jgi:hypothetical protein
MTLNEKKLSIQRLLAFGFEACRVNPNSYLYYYKEIEINCNYIKQIKSDIWYLDIILSFETNLQMMFTDIFFENQIDPEAILNSVKKLEAAVEFIEL